MTNPILAIDIGASKTLIAIFLNKKIIKLKRLKTPSQNIENHIYQEIRNLLLESGYQNVTIAGIAAPGPLDYSRGAIVNPPNIAQRHVNLLEMINGLVEYVIIANDAVAGVWAEKVLGGSSSDNMVLVSIGSGIGGGVIVDNRLLLGRNGNAHEIGHIPLNFEYKAKCGCGGIGHWEAIAGGFWIPRTASYLAEKLACNSRSWKLAKQGLLSTEQLFEFARKGDCFATKVLEYIARVHSAGLAAITVIYDPEIIFISGGAYIPHKDMLKEKINNYIKDYLGIFEKPKILDASFGEYQSLYGAYAIAYRPPIELLQLNRHELAPPA